MQVRVLFRVSPPPRRRRVTFADGQPRRPLPGDHPEPQQAPPQRGRARSAHGGGRRLQPTLRRPAPGLCSAEGPDRGSGSVHG